MASNGSGYTLLSARFYETGEDDPIAIRFKILTH
jgi:hypothetical protein